MFDDVLTAAIVTREVFTVEEGGTITTKFVLFELLCKSLCTLTLSESNFTNSSATFRTTAKFWRFTKSWMLPLRPLRRSLFSVCAVTVGAPTGSLAREIWPRRSVVLKNSCNSAFIESE